MSDKKQAQLSQGHNHSASLFAQSHPLPKMHLLEHLFMFLTKTVFKTTCFHISPPFFIFPFFVFFCFSFGKKAAINDQVAFSCTVLGFHVQSSVPWPCRDMFHCLLYLNSFHACKKTVTKSQKRKKNNEITNKSKHAKHVSVFYSFYRKENAVNKMFMYLH